MFLEKLYIIFTLLLLVTFLTLSLLTPLINYGALSQSIANGRTYILYPGLFSVNIFVLLILMSFFLLGRGLPHYVIMFFVFMWPMIITLNFLFYGFVVGDQPRLEFALAHLIVNGKVTFEEALKKSSYFNWPSLWILQGIFSNITGLSPFEAPALLIVMVYLLLGLSIIFSCRKLFPKYGSSLVLSSVIAYTVLNPYKILHLCPQIYALVLFMIFISILFKEVLTPSDFIILFVLSASIITAHPLTSVVLIGVLIATITLKMLNKVQGHHRRAFFSGTTGIIAFFIAWNSNYENFIKSVFEEILKSPELQTLSPICNSLIYEEDLFYKLMSLYRYSCLFTLGMLTLTAIILMFKRGFSKKRVILSVFAGIVIGSLAFNFIPGSFFHRLLYFTTTIMVVTTPFAIEGIPYLLKRFAKPRHFHSLIKVVEVIILFLLPILSHVAVIEFVTNNNPVVVITSPYETSSYMFIAKRYDFRRCVGVTSGALPFYISLLDPTKAWNIMLISNKVIQLTILPNNYLSAEKFIEIVYTGKLFVVSPREKFILYTNTLFREYGIFDNYLNNNYDKVYDNEIFRAYDRK